MLTSLVAEVYLGAVAPESLRIIIVQGESPIDLSTVTAATIAVKTPSGVALTWAATLLDGATPTLLTIEHVFLADDLSETGLHAATVSLTVPSGTIRCYQRSFRVSASP